MAVQVGAVTGIQARCVWRVSQAVSARVALRVGTTGVDLEVGGTQRISEFSAAGLAIAVGLYVRALDSPCSVHGTALPFPSKFCSHAYLYAHAISLLSDNEVRWLADYRGPELCCMYMSMFVAPIMEKLSTLVREQASE